MTNNPLQHRLPGEYGFLKLKAPATQLIGGEWVAPPTAQVTRT